MRNGNSHFLYNYLSQALLLMTR